MKRLVLALILAPSLAAADICGPLMRLVEHARAGTLQAADPGLAASALSGEATCGLAVEAAGEALFCYTAYPFRNGEAEVEAARVEAALLGCFEGGEVEVDAAVNHPDSYAARSVAVEGAVVSLSVKDKGALGRTLVFLRVGPGGE